MHSVSRHRRPALPTLACLLALPTPALAYIDPNTGGLIFQLLAPLIAMIASAWLLARDFIRTQFTRLWRWVRGVPAPAAAEAPGRTDPHH